MFIIRSFLIKLLKQRIFTPITAVYVFLRIKELKKNNEKKKNYIFTILVLNYKRWIKDIEVLNNDDRIRILILPSEVQAQIGRLFLRSLSGKINNGEWWRHEYKNEVNKLINEYVNYLTFLIPCLKLFKNFQVISSCSFYYLNDKAWQKVCHKIKDVNFICLHKENQKDDSIMELMINEYKNKGIKFEGNFVFVYNRKEKECMEKSHVCESKRIIITGCLRMDKLIKESNLKKYDQNNNAITLFSFRHSFGGMRLKNDDYGGFSISRKNGCVNYFDNVHGNLAIYAIQNPDIPIFIKLKWEENWLKQVSNAIYNKTGKSLNQIPNLQVGSDFDPKELIEKSRIIIGINSTALVESRILGKEVLIPLFDEPLDKYFQNVYFKKYFNKEFNLVQNEKQFLKELDRLFFTTKNLKEVGKELVEEFLGYYDSNSYKRVYDYMLKIVGNEF